MIGYKIIHSAFHRAGDDNVIVRVGEERLISLCYASTHSAQFTRVSSNSIIFS